MNASEFHDLLDAQIAKCEGNDYLLGRLRTYLDTILPSYLDKADEAHRQRTIRRDNLTKNCSEFIEKFLLQNSYTFSSYAELFFKYEDANLSIYSEDDIQHEILSQISQARTLAPWKHKIKISVMKRIKERSPLLIIPESPTIQGVIDLLRRGYFPSKTSAKYFMTIIGDFLLGKDSDRIYITDPSIKNLINEIMHHSYSLFGVTSTAFQSMKFKYHSVHPYAQCRLVRSNKFDKAIPVQAELRRSMLNVLCVCAHYSTRYHDADGFLSQHADDDIASHALWLRSRTLKDIVNSFIEDELQACGDSEISYKNMKFLWKRYLETLQVPHIASYESLHQELKERLDHTKGTEVFTSLTSPHLPLVSSFRHFWDTYLTKDDDSELEMSEVVTLFSASGGKIGRSVTDPPAVLMDLIKHFYPEVLFEEDKYIIGYRCTLWNKGSDVANALECFKVDQKDLGCEYATNIDAIYERYSKEPKHRFVSKRFFEKTTLDILADYVDSEGYISPSWWAC